MGQFATHDLQMQKRKTNSFLFGNSRKSRQKTRVFHYNSTEISSHYVNLIMTETGTGYDIQDDSNGVSCMLYAKMTTPRSYILNLLDYNIPLNYIDRNYGSKEKNYEIVLTLPRAVKVKQVRSFDLNSMESKKVKHFQDGSTLQFSIAGSDAYMVCEISI